MKCIIAVEETIKNIRRYEIEVKDEYEGDEIADKINDKIERECNHPDDVSSCIEEYAEIISVEEEEYGSEYEIFDTYYPTGKED